MAAKRVAVLDPSGRLLADLAPVAARARIDLISVATGDPTPGCTAVLIAPAVAAELPPPAAGAPPRWIVGDAGSHAARVAGAAAQAAATGVLLTPVTEAALLAAAGTEPSSAELDVARARALIATSLVDLTGAAAETLAAVAEGFTAHDCVVWWRDGNQMVPTAARPFPSDGYRAQIAAAARVAAAAAGTVITSGGPPRAVIAHALKSAPTEIAGLVAVVADAPRRFTGSERSDLAAIAARLTRELSWLASHRRLVAEGERLLAASLHDPLTGAMTRGAFEQAIGHEIAAGARRGEKLTLAMIDVVGTRRINLLHGHQAGDEVLAQVANRIRATVRGNDPIGRLGGDEIAVLLVGAPEEHASAVVRKLIGKIQDEPVKVGDTEIAVQVRAIATELARGERSGEAAFARCYGARRAAPVGDVQIVAPDARADSGDAADTGTLSAGTVVGGTYRVLHELSRGAMGVVYRGEDLGLGRAVAIKVLRSDLASDRDLVARFRAEAAILASLHHPNLVQVYALGEHAGDVYFVMELVEGQPLSEVLRAQLQGGEWFPVNAIAQIVLELGDALDAMHARGVIHRDVKPANVLLDREQDRAVLVDVGIAVRAGDQRDAGGTPGFAAPESFVETDHAPTTDVYGLAATMYCLITGRPPFGLGPAASVVQRQLHDPLVPASALRPGLSTAVDDVLGKALHPQPRRRWASASTFAVALARALERMPADRERVAAARTVGAEEPTIADPALAPIDQALALTPGPPPGLATARTAAGRVRAAHLRVLSRLIRHHVGVSGMAKIVQEAPTLATALSPTLAPLDWVQLMDLLAGLERARAWLPNQPVARAVGRRTLEATFARLFGADPTTVQAETALAALPTFWLRYHDWGDIAVEVEPTRAEIVLAGYPGHPDVCVVVAAELERIVELTGAAEVTVAHAACACTGASRCEYRLGWTPA